MYPGNGPEGPPRRPSPQLEAADGAVSRGGAAFSGFEQDVVWAATFVEVSIVIESRFGPEGLRDPDRFFERANIDVAAVDPEQAKLARRAFSRFGRGQHPAGLYFGDCFSFAMAVARGEPLLTRGEDLARTDVVSVMPSSRG
jgi:ribonuclease VapC